MAVSELRAQTARTNHPNRTDVAWGLLLGLAGVRIALYLLSSGPLAYGYFRDELYYLACADQLAWGYVDHPPASVALLALTRGLLGDSLLALRLVPALLGSFVIVCTGLLAREMGGTRLAQGTAALAALIAPIYLGLTGFYSMNALDLGVWIVAVWVMLRIVNDGDPRWWLLLGVVLGLGLLNKISVLWLGFGLTVGLILTPHRRWFLTPWPWCGALIAFSIFAPHVLWQAQHDWPTREFMHNARELKMVEKAPLAFLSEQVLMFNPVALPLWLAGLLSFFFAPSLQRFRLLGWMWLTVCALLMFSGAARAYYLAAAFPPLLAAGGLFVEWFAKGAPRLTMAITAILVTGGTAIAPLALPLLPVDTFIAYQETLGLSAPVEERQEMAELPQNFADMFGWEEVVAAIEDAYESLPQEEQQQVLILTDNYGEAGAVDFFGRKVGLPQARSGHNNYWLWGPGDRSGEIAIVLTGAEDDLRRVYGSVTPVRNIDCHYCLPEVSRKTVYICRELLVPRDEAWREIKAFI